MFPLSDRTAKLKLQYNTSIEWSSPPSSVCLNNVANQMKGYMNMAFSNTSNSVDCSQMDRWIDVAVAGDQVSLNINLVPFEWNRKISAENCLWQLWLFNSKLFNERFIQDLSSTCQVRSFQNLTVSLTYICNPDYEWNGSTKSCVLGKYYVFKDYFSIPELKYSDL